MKTKVGLIILLGIFISLGFSTLRGEDAVIFIGDGSGLPGTSGNSVSIDMDNSVTVGSMEFWLHYDSTIGIHVPSSDGVQTTTRTSTYTVSYTVDESTPSDSVVHILLYHTGGGNIPPGTGSILSVLFDVEATANPGDTSQLWFSEIIVSDPLGNPLDVDYSDLGVFTITSVPSYKISGKVSGDVVEGVTINLSGAKEDTTTTNFEGYYEFTGLANGTYLVTPYKEGYVFSPPNQEVVIDNCNKENVNFTSTWVAFTISGQITGDIQVGVWVTLEQDGAVLQTVVTEADGTYAFHGVEPGTYTVTPSLEGYSFTPSSRTVEVTTGDVTGVDFVSTALPEYKISGTVKDDNDNPVPNVTITLSGDGTGTTQTDGSGYYEFTDLSAGTYTVTPEKAGYVFTPSSQDVTLTQDEPQKEVNFTGRQYKISGHIKDSSDNPIPDVQINLTGEVTAQTLTNSDGYYEFTGLSEGDYTVTPSKSGYTFTPESASVELTPADPQKTQDFIGTENDPPDRPAGISPSTTGTSLSPVLTASLFSDPNGDEHFASLWQIREFSEEDTGIMVIEKYQVPGSHTYEVRLGMLNPATTYEWRVRYMDDKGAWSEWSEWLQFTTKSKEEAGGDYPGIAFPDSSGCTVEVNGSPIHLSSEEGIFTLVYPETDLPLSIYDFPYGMYTFRLEGVTEGGAVQVTFTLPTPFFPNDHWYKLQNGNYSLFDSAIVNSDELPSTEVILQFTDGGEGDADGLANGVIVDPSGPALETTEPPTSAQLDARPGDKKITLYYIIPYNTTSYTITRSYKDADGTHENTIVSESVNIENAEDCYRTYTDTGLRNGIKYTYVLECTLKEGGVSSDTDSATPETVTGGGGGGGGGGCFISLLGVKR